MMNKFVFKNLEIISSIDHKLGDSLKDYAGVLSWHASIYRSKLKLSFYHLSLAGTDEVLLGSNVLGAFCPQCSACSLVQAKDFNGYTIESVVYQMEISQKIVAFSEYMNFIKASNTNFNKVHIF